MKDRCCDRQGRWWLTPWRCRVGGDHKLSRNATVANARRDNQFPIHRCRAEIC
ncbi:hypothetical protein IF2G_07400 [Cordyceps javanica]|nr:hypothetical protein IF2G_07400 [Cordyceps javanica]